MTIARDCLVTLDYSINDTNGNRLQEEEELVYLHGEYGHIFPALEKALEGREIGDSFRITLVADEAFGRYDPSLVVTEVLSELPEEVSVGMELDGYYEDDLDDIIVYTVTKIEGDQATLDGNHPFAQMDLVFEGRIMDVYPASEEEISKILEHDGHQH